MTATYQPRTVWYLIGEDAGAMACDELLPRDWRTKARALKAWSLLVGEPFSMHWLHQAKVHHGVRCWAPPGEYYGSYYYDWCTAPVDGWVELTEYCHETDDDDYGDVVILDLDHYGAILIGLVCAAVAPEIHLVSAGDGWPWMSRVVSPATIVTLQ